MSLAPLALIAILAATPAPVPPGAIRFDRVDPHSAALFVARAFDVSVMIVGGSNAPLTIGLEAKTAEGALRELAQAAGLSLAIEEQRFLIAPAESIAALGKFKALQGGRPFTFRELHADAAWVLRLLAQEDKLTIVGSLAGQVSFSTRFVPAREVLSALVRLAGVDAKVRGRTVTLSGPGTLPVIAESEEYDCPIEGHLYRVDTTILKCVPSSGLEAAATAVFGGRAVVLMRQRGAGSARTATVGVGVVLGSPRVTITGVDTDGVDLDDGTRLPLGAPALRGCTDASLRSFSPLGGPATHQALPPETFEWVDRKAWSVESVRCEPSETDAQCDARARQVALAARAGRRILSSAVGNDTDGILARIEVDGRVLNYHLSRLEDVASALEDAKARGARVVLLSSDPPNDPSTRRSLVQLVTRHALVEQRTRERARVEWKPGADAGDALGATEQQAERAGLDVREAARLDGGTLRLVIGCP